MSDALPLWAGMPTPELPDTAHLRLDSISFFALVFLSSAGLIALAWNGLRRDFPALPRLGYFRALGLTFLWGLLFVLVLTMISGARELLTPGAWKKQGWTYTLEDAAPAKAAPEVAEIVRRQKIEELRFALWDYARRNGNRFPASPDEAGFPAERWQIPGPTRLRYLYSGKSPPTGEVVPMTWEPEVFGTQRFVLFSDGAIDSMGSAALERFLKRGMK